MYIENLCYRKIVTDNSSYRLILHRIYNIFPINYLSYRYIFYRKSNNYSYRSEYVFNYNSISIFTVIHLKTL